jgi:hypothetical protein
MKRVCLPSPARRASEAIGKLAAGAGLFAAGADLFAAGADLFAAGADLGGWVSTAPAIPGEQNNAAPHNSNQLSNIWGFMRLANESLPPGSPFYRNRTTGLTAALVLAVNKAKCCYLVTHHLHEAVNPRMYNVLTAKISGCVAFSLPVQRRDLQKAEIPASFRPSAASAARG